MRMLRLSQGQFVEALELMRTPSLSDEEIDKRIRAFRNEQDSWEGRFAALLDVVLDLIYSGNADQAWHALATRWPQPEEAGITLAEFESELRAALRESPYAAEIEMLNVTGMSHAAQVADQGQLRAANVPANRAALTED